MVIEKTNIDGNIVVIPEGRLDSLTAGDLEAVLDQEIGADTRTLTLDMGKVDFISSKGIRVLVAAYKKLEGREMILTNPNASVLEVLKLSNLLKIFTIK